MESRIYQHLFSTTAHTSGGRGLSEAERNFHRILERKKDFLLSADDMEELQTLEQEGESSEDIPIFKEPVQRCPLFFVFFLDTMDNTHRPLHLRSNA